MKKDQLIQEIQKHQTAGDILFDELFDDQISFLVLNDLAIELFFRKAIQKVSLLKKKNFFSFSQKIKKMENNQMVEYFTNYLSKMGRDISNRKRTIGHEDVMEFLTDVWRNVFQFCCSSKEITDEKKIFVPAWCIVNQIATELIEITKDTKATLLQKVEVQLRYYEKMLSYTLLFTALLPTFLDELQKELKRQNITKGQLDYWFNHPKEWTVEAVVHWIKTSVDIDQEKKESMIKEIQQQDLCGEKLFYGLNVNKLKLFCSNDSNTEVIFRQAIKNLSL